MSKEIVAINTKKKTEKKMENKKGNGIRRTEKTRHLKLHLNNGKGLNNGPKTNKRHASQMAQATKVDSWPGQDRRIEKPGRKGRTGRRTTDNGQQTSCTKEQNRCTGRKEVTYCKSTTCKYRVSGQRLTLG